MPVGVRLTRPGRMAARVMFSHFSLFFLKISLLGVFSLLLFSPLLILLSSSLLFLFHFYPSAMVQQTKLDGHSRLTFPPLVLSSVSFLFSSFLIISVAIKYLQQSDE